MLKRLLRIFGVLFALVLLGGLLGAGGLVYVFWHYGRGLPDYEQLATYEPAVTTRVHAGDGRLIAEYARERRLFVPVTAMPKLVIDAFLAAEDKNFYSHSGVDFASVLRAAVTNLASIGQNRRPVGASTITQQVAKNFLLTNEVSLARKIKEAILAFRIERAFSKNRILELYLNEIYLGYGAYGVAAAALYYFDKSLDELSIAEAAYLAALPKAPNNYNPAKAPERAKSRRDWVIDRMAEENFVTAAEAEAAKDSPLKVRLRQDTKVTKAEWFTEEVRRELLARYGERKLYEGGLSVRTSMDPKLQALAEKALRDGLMAYDRRHGWRGPLGKLPTGEGWASRLATIPVPAGIGSWQVALVLGMDDKAADVGFADGSRGQIPMAQMTWARQWKKDQLLGPPVRQPKDVLQPGDVVAVEPVPDGQRGAMALRQIPDVGGAIVAMDPHTGRVLALVGGWDYAMSQFDRAVQAMRQPGSSFKPFVYAAALDHGFTPSSLVLDAPFVIDQGPGLGKWKPGNYTKQFYGPSTLRLGLEKSRNLMTVRLAQSIGMEAVVENAKRFGIVDDMPTSLSMALGAGETTLLKLTTAYAELVNGGRKITPSLIDRLQDRNGHTVFKHDTRPCPHCSIQVEAPPAGAAGDNDGDAAGEQQKSTTIPIVGVSGTMVKPTEFGPDHEPQIPDTRPQIISPATAYQVVSMLQGVVERGTGIRIHEIGKPLAGKTGTTNDSNDTWFLGFSPDLAVGVFVGFDNPRTLGKHETGSSVAVPVFKEFMAEALAGKPGIPFRVPPGIRLVRVNANTGLPARPGDKPVILEAFKPGTEPTAERAVLDGSQGEDGVRGYGVTPTASTPTPAVGTGGLY